MDTADIQERISRQRVKHIVESYQLEGSDGEAFFEYLEDVLKTFAHPLIELALVEVLAQAWKTVPMVKGMPFLQEVHAQLKLWQKEPVMSQLTRHQFEDITGLDGAIIFGNQVFTVPQPLSS
jgi:hypothetical protein